MCDAMGTLAHSLDGRVDLVTLDSSGDPRYLPVYRRYLPYDTAAIPHAGRVILDGRVAVTDVPVDHDDRVYLVYLVERHIQSKADLDGLTAEYTAHSQACGQPAAIASRQVAEQLAAVLVAAPS